MSLTCAALSASTTYVSSTACGDMTSVCVKAKSGVRRPVTVILRPSGVVSTVEAMYDSASCLYWGVPLMFRQMQPGIHEPPIFTAKCPAANTRS